MGCSHSNVVGVEPLELNGNVNILIPSSDISPTASSPLLAQESFVLSDAIKTSYKLSDYHTDKSGVLFRDAKPFSNAFIAAVKRGNFEQVQSLLFQEGKTIDINVAGMWGFTPLIIALQLNYDSIINLLLDQEEIDTNICTEKGVSPILFACISSTDAIVAKLLLKKANPCPNMSKPVMISKINASYPCTPFSLVSMYGSANLFNLMLEHQPNLNDGFPFATTKSCSRSIICATASALPINATPLIVACAYGNFAVVNEILSNHDVDLTSADSEGSTALHHAIRCDCETSALEICKAFLTCKAFTKNAFSQFDKNGEVPLHLACRRKHTQICSIFLNAECNVDEPTLYDGCNPLHISVLRRDERTIRLLLQSKRCTELLVARNHEGLTPAELAIRLPPGAAAVTVLLQNATSAAKTNAIGVEVDSINTDSNTAQVNSLLAHDPIISSTYENMEYITENPTQKLNFRNSKNLVTGNSEIPMRDKFQLELEDIGDVD